MTYLREIAFDIETTGFAGEDEVTVIGVTLPLGCRIFFQTDGRVVNTKRIKNRLQSATDTNVQLSSHDTEEEMLAEFNDFLEDKVAAKDFLIVAYNGERYRGGFDLPFLRTRCAYHDVKWPFNDVPYADILPLFKHQFNTTKDDGDVNDLCGVYEILIGGPWTALDPFNESDEAVKAFDEGEFEPLLKHNLADILRTDDLAALAKRYCSKSDFNLKSLTPTERESE